MKSDVLCFVTRPSAHGPLLSSVILVSMSTKQLQQLSSISMSVQIGRIVGAGAYANHHLYCRKSWRHISSCPTKISTANPRHGVPFWPRNPAKDYPYTLSFQVQSLSYEGETPLVGKRWYFDLRFPPPLARLEPLDSVSMNPTPTSMIRIIQELIPAQSAVYAPYANWYPGIRISLYRISDDITYNVIDKWAGQKPLLSTFITQL